MTHTTETRRRVQSVDIMQMALRLSHAAEDVVMRIQYPGPGTPEHQRARRAYARRLEALRRLAYALERQGGER